MALRTNSDRLRLVGCPMRTPAVRRHEGAFGGTVRPGVVAGGRQNALAYPATTGRHVPGYRHAAAPEVRGRRRARHRGHHEPAGDIQYVRTRYAAFFSGPNQIGTASGEE